MKDVIDLVVGYFTLKRLQKGGYLRDEEFNLSFGEFIIQSVRAIKNIEKVKEVKENENK